MWLRLNFEESLFIYLSRAVLLESYVALRLPMEKMYS